MKFELLPNEILIECFEYFNVLEIYHSFDQLNTRFNQLIGNLPLPLKYDHYQKLMFDQFCMKMCSETVIKHQIYSIEISNENSCDQIQTFLSWFSLQEFPYLQRLVLTGVDQHHTLKLKPMLPTLTELKDLRLIKPDHDTDQLVSSDLTSQLRRLTVRNLPQSIRVSHAPCSITHLTLSSCNTHLIFIILEHVPLLIYLNIKNMSDTDSEEQSRTFLPTAPHLHLNKLILTNYYCTFEAFESMAIQMPNLHSLIVRTNINDELIDAPRWEHLIKSALQKLNSFKFKFHCNHSDDFLHRFEQFQGQFWHEEHHWYTDYSFTRFYALIHTVPLLERVFKIRKFMTKDEQNQMHTFFRATELQVDYNAIDHDFEYYFPNVRSLTICHESIHQISEPNEPFRLSAFKINVSNVRHLTMANIPEENVLFILLMICKNAPRLASLCLEPCDLQMLIDNTELYNYLSKKIQIFENKNHLLFKNDDDIQLFCRIFIHLKRLKCLPLATEHLFYLLQHLPNLSMIEILLSTDVNAEKFLALVKEHRRLLNRTFHIEKMTYVDKKSFFSRKYGCCLWINPI